MLATVPPPRGDLTSRVARQIATPLGVLRLVATERALVGVYFPDHQPAPPAEILGAPLVPSHPVLDRAAVQLGEYFAGERRNFDVPLDPHGTVFQREVWAALATIPYGATWSYAELARAIGHPAAVRAVGAANGRNPLSILVPCHRVVGSRGAAVGYAGGVAAKQQLLDLERGVQPRWWS